MQNINVVLFDYNQDKLKPFTWTKPVAELRVGILKIREKWEKVLNRKVSTYSKGYLRGKYPTVLHQQQNLLINATVLPTDDLIEELISQPLNTVTVKGGNPIALKVTAQDAEQFFNKALGTHVSTRELSAEVLMLEACYDIFRLNEKAIHLDFTLLTKGRTSQPLSESNRLIGDKKYLFIEEGADIECSILNVKGGPIYVGKGATVMEGSIIRGAFALCDGASTKLGTKIYGATTIGPHSKVGGEVNNSVIQGYSNKGHDGFLGNSVIGEWCNLGADTNNSNLKNNYKTVKVWNYETETYTDSSLQFCGLMMGDHSKCGINTMFNTGTVIGVNANIYGGGFPEKFIPSFAWGGDTLTTYSFEKALETAQIVMKRRNIDLTEEDETILKHVFEETKKYRKWSK